MYGESDGDKKSIKITGSGQNLYTGSFNFKGHGVDINGIGIKNDLGSIANLSDIKTDSTIENTRGSIMNARKVEQKKLKKTYLRLKKVGMKNGGDK